MPAMARTFFTELSDLRKEALATENVALLSFVKSVEKWLTSKTWKSHSKASLYLSNYRKTNSEIADLFGVKESSAKQIGYDLNKEIFSTVGSDFFELVRGKEYGRAVSRMEAAQDEYSVDRLLRHDVLSKVGEMEGDLLLSGGTESVSIEDCEEEILFLSGNSIRALEKALDNLDPNRLVFLKKLLEGREGSVDDRASFVNFLREGN